MGCPATVPTYGFDTCGKSIMLTRDGDGTTPTSAPCYGGGSAIVSSDKATLSLVISDDMVMQQTREFLIENRIFAIFTIHLGRKAWHIVRHSGAGVTFKTPSNNFWEGQLKVDVLGYTYTGTPMTMPEVLVDSGGVELVDAYGNTLYSKIVAGEATGCITL